MQYPVPTHAQAPSTHTFTQMLLPHITAESRNEERLSSDGKECVERWGGFTVRAKDGELLCVYKVEWL